MDTPITALNPNKIINLYRTDDNNRSWRTAISDIVSGVSSENEETSQVPAEPEKHMIYFNDVLRGTNVHENIELLMTENPEKFKNSVNTKYPISNFFQNAKEGFKNNPIIGSAIQLFRAGKNAVDIGSALFDSATSSNDLSTSKQFTPWVINVPSWSGDYKSLNFKYSFTFTMGQYGLWDAKEEVVKPAFNLIAPVFPQYISALYAKGPIPNTMNLATDLLTNLGAFKKDSQSNESGLTGWLEGIASGLDKLLLSSYGKFTWDIEFGTKIRIRRCMINTADAEFSKETDQNGYPVSAIVTLSFDSIMPLALTSDTDNHMAARFGD